MACRGSTGSGTCTSTSTSTRNGVNRSTSAAHRGSAPSRRPAAGRAAGALVGGEHERARRSRGPSSTCPGSSGRRARRTAGPVRALVGRAGGRPGRGHGGPRAPRSHARRHRCEPLAVVGGDHVRRHDPTRRRARRTGSNGAQDTHLQAPSAGRRHERRHPAAPPADRGRNRDDDRSPSGRDRRPRPVDQRRAELRRRLRRPHRRHPAEHRGDRARRAARGCRRSRCTGR